jgi:hypothetical protein
MAYCGPRGIPLSVFLSWDTDDQDAALLWQAREARRCSGCGTHPDDWDPDAGGRRDAYHATVEVCPGCRTVDALRDRTDPKTTPPGAHVVLRAYDPEEIPDAH